jgi:hypothetical protein
MWGVGPVLEFPTGGELRGSQKWSAGVSVVALAQPGDWTFGILANNVWSFAGDSDAQDVNKGLFQYFIVYQLGRGWYVNSAPIINIDWEADSGQKWKVPFGAGGGKLMSWGKLPGPATVLPAIAGQSGVSRRWPESEVLGLLKWSRIRRSQCSQGGIPGSIRGAQTGDPELQGSTRWPLAGATQIYERE